MAALQFVLKQKQAEEGYSQKGECTPSYERDGILFRKGSSVLKNSLNSAKGALCGAPGYRWLWSKIPEGKEKDTLASHDSKRVC